MLYSKENVWENIFFPKDTPKKICTLNNSETKQTIQQDTQTETKEIKKERLKQEIQAMQERMYKRDSSEREQLWLDVEAFAVRAKTIFSPSELAFDFYRPLWLSYWYVKESLALYIKAIETIESEWKQKGIKGIPHSFWDSALATYNGLQRKIGIIKGEQERLIYLDKWIAFAQSIQTYFYKTYEKQLQALQDMQSESEPFSLDPSSIRKMLKISQIEDSIPEEMKSLLGSAQATIGDFSWERAYILRKSGKLEEAKEARKLFREYVFVCSDFDEYYNWNYEISENGKDPFKLPSKRCETPQDKARKDMIQKLKDFRKETEILEKQWNNKK